MKLEPLYKEHNKMYHDLLMDKSYKEAFILLQKNTSALEDKILQKKHIKDFFSVLDTTIDEQSVEGNELLYLAKELISALQNIPALEDYKKRLPILLDAQKISIMLAFLMRHNDYNNPQELEEIKYLLPFVDRDIKDYTYTIDLVLKEKNKSALNFFYEYMSNSHYNDDELFKRCTDFSAKDLIELIEKNNLDINNSEGGTIMYHLLMDKKPQTFKSLLDYFGAQINWGQVYTKNGQVKDIFEALKSVPNAIDYFSILLLSPHTSANLVERIAKIVLEDTKLLTMHANTGLFDKLFANTYFDPQVANLGQSSLPYGLIAKIGTNADNKSLSEAYLRVLQSYLEIRGHEEIPAASKYHIVGAAVYLARECDSASAMDACCAVVRQYKDYLNKPNPNGELPIAMVPKNSPVYRMLINNGAVNIDLRSGFMSGVFRALGIQKKTEPIAQVVETNTFAEVKMKMKKDFREMYSLLSEDICDTEVKMKCENLFLEANNLVLKMEKNGLDNDYENIHFLSQNFSNLLRRGINTYIDLCKGSVDFAQNKQEHLQKAKEEILLQVGLLEKQINLVKENIFASVESNAQFKNQVNTRVIEQNIAEPKLRM